MKKTVELTLNTVSCGDSMVAGFATGMARKLPPQETLRLAMAVSAANALSVRMKEYDPANFKALLPQV